MNIIKVKKGQTVYDVDLDMIILFFSEKRLTYRTGRFDCTTCECHARGQSAQKYDCPLFGINKIEVSSCVSDFIDKNAVLSYLLENIPEELI